MSHFLDLRRCFPRQNWQSKVEQTGFTWHTLGGKPYWAEGSYLQLELAAAEVLEDAANTLHALCLEACSSIIERDWFDRLGITPVVARLIEESWRRRDPALYGRFDLAWDGRGQPKLLEYNADTPTSLLESSIIQWQWKEEVFPEADQLNSLHEGLVEAWKQFPEHRVHFTFAWENQEDRQTTAYLAETAEQAGKEVILLDLAEIGLSSNHSLRDLEERDILRLFKLYPWEFLAQDEIFPSIHHLLYSLTEPIWKMLLSNKAILPILWELNPRHPLLLPAHFSPEAFSGKDMVVKPFLGREGANVSIHRAGRPIASNSGDYAGQPMIYQERADVLRGIGTSCIFGLWMVQDTCRGLSVREDDGMITTNASRFVPHILK